MPSTSTGTPVHVLSPAAFARVFAAERERAARSDIEATLIAFAPGDVDARKFAARLRCRETDYVGFSHDGDVLVLLWNTPPTSADLFVEQALSEWPGDGIGVQSFPLVENDSTARRPAPTTNEV